MGLSPKYDRKLFAYCAKEKISVRKFAHDAIVVKLDELEKNKK